MGWTFASRSIEEIVDEMSKMSAGCTLLAQEVVGANLWQVVEQTIYPDAPKRLILLTKMASRGDRWGYKQMDETMGPYESNCPLAFLDLAPREDAGNDSGFTAQFRARVRAYHALRQSLEEVAQ